MDDLQTQSQQDSSIFDTRDFKDIILNQLNKRKLKSRAYSIRAFARDIGINHSTLTDVLNGRHGLSPKMARAIADKLNFTADETAYFCDLVESKHGRSSKQKKAASLRLMKYNKQPYYQTLQNDAFELFRHWYNPAILELIAAQGANELSIANTLQIEIEKVRASLQIMLRLGLIEKKDQKLKKKSDFLFGDSPIPSEIIRGFHKQLLQKAMIAIDSQPMNQRTCFSSVISIDPAKIREALEALGSTHQNFVVKNSVEAQKKPAVYAVSSVMYRLDEGQS